MQARKSYPTDLNDTEWQILAPLIPAAKPGGRPEVYPKREIVNAIVVDEAGSEDTYGSQRRAGERGRREANNCTVL